MATERGRVKTLSWPDSGAFRALIKKDFYIGILHIYILLGEWFTSLVNKESKVCRVEETDSDCVRSFNGSAGHTPIHKIYSQ